MKTFNILLSVIIIILVWLSLATINDKIIISVLFSAIIGFWISSYKAIKIKHHETLLR